jgi:hypothetical protein
MSRHAGYVDSPKCILILCAAVLVYCNTVVAATEVAAVGAAAVLMTVCPHTQDPSDEVSCEVEAGAATARLAWRWACCAAAAAAAGEKLCGRQ